MIEPVRLSLILCVSSVLTPFFLEAISLSLMFSSLPEKENRQRGEQSFSLKFLSVGWGQIYYSTITRPAGKEPAGKLTAPTSSNPASALLPVKRKA